MSFEGEFAHYEPLRRVLDNEKVKDFLSKMKIRETSTVTEEAISKVLNKPQLQKNSAIQPDLVLAIDGSFVEAPVKHGYPNANMGYVTVASVLIDLKKLEKLEFEEFPDPKAVRNTENVGSVESVFPGCNVFTENESPKETYRRILYEELKDKKVFESGETLLETYEVLLKYHIQNPVRAKSPIENFEDKEMTIDFGKYTCPYSGKALYSSDALRLHELMNPMGSNGELFGQTMSTLEKLWFMNIIRYFEKENLLSTLRRIAFFIDGPLAIFSTDAWLKDSICKELARINEIQKSINGSDLLIIGLEKSGTFFNHFVELDTERDGNIGKFPKEGILLLDDNYIKKNIIISESTKPYGADTYFGRKFFYKAKAGQLLVPVLPFFTNYQKDTKTANPDQFPRLSDALALLDKMVSNQYPNSTMPLISAHAEAAIPLNIGSKIFEQIAREIRERK